MYCRMCGAQIADNSEICPECREKQHITGIGETEKGTANKMGEAVGNFLKPIIKEVAPVVVDVLCNKISKGAAEKVGKLTSKEKERSEETESRGVKAKLWLGRKGE